tara:strand:- start:10932 stop:11087 length:156 start_codon:yes stop_codon:yes gene_type:complete
MSEVVVIERIRAILDEHKEQTIIPYYRIEQVIKDYDRDEEKFIDNLYNNMT